MTARADSTLGATIRIWRDRLAPERAGRNDARSRRAAGLRREELAELACVSVDYIVRLEQGRATSPSAQVVASLARALQLNRSERDHLYRLAGLQAPSDLVISHRIPPGVERLISRLGETPTGVFTADWQLLWWNRSWVALLGDPALVAPEERNLVRSHFPVDGERGRLSLWPVQSDRAEQTDLAIVADLRRASARYPKDRGLGELIRRTLAGNEGFARMWHSGVVGGHVEDHKTIMHPSVGDVTVGCDVLTDSDTDLKIVIYTAPPGTEDATKLELTRIADPASVGEPPLAEAGSITAG